MGKLWSANSSKWVLVEAIDLITRLLGRESFVLDERAHMCLFEFFSRAYDSNIMRWRFELAPLAQP